VRRRLSLCLLVVLPLATPTGVYELLQKSGERGAAPGAHWIAVSLQAEMETPWRPRTGYWIWDKTQHEFQETERFLRLLSSH